MSNLAEDTRAEGRLRGRVARLFSAGYGFIAPEDPTKDPGGRGIFFHAVCLVGQWETFERLHVGAAVEFTPMADERGPRAGDVRVLEVLPMQPAAARKGGKREARRRE